MISYTIEAPELEPQIKRLERFAPIAHPRLERAMEQSVEVTRNNVLPLVPVFTGALRKSIFSEVKSEAPLNIVGKVGSSLTSEIYPSVMEFGRRAGKAPPSSALERWVHLKLGVPVEDAPAVARIVARNIGRRGITGKAFMRRGWEKSKDKVAEFFTRAIDLIARDITNGRD